MMGRPPPRCARGRRLGDAARSRRSNVSRLALLVATLVPGVRCASTDSWVTPQTAGKMTHVMMLPRVNVGATPSACPWDETGLVTWTPPSGEAPDYTLPANSKVLIGANATVGNVVIPADSELVFANADVELIAASISVLGKLRIGSSTCRFGSTKTARITLTGVASDQGASSMLHKGIVASGSGLIEMYGALRQPTWTRLATTAAAGDTTIVLYECVEWAAGDVLLITTTHAEDHRRHNRNEKRTVSAVECAEHTVDGATHSFGKVTLTSALAYQHYAARGEYQAEVALLSRNVVVRGDASSIPTDPQPDDMTCADSTRSDIPCAPSYTCKRNDVSSSNCGPYYITGHGGHLMAGDSSTAKISSVEFHRMGRTNQVGRYPVHLHLLGTGGVDSFVSDCSVHESYYRAFVVHSTNNTLITRNVAYDVIGHAFYLESGEEEANEISFNLGSHVHPIGFAEDLAGQNTNDKFVEDVSHPAVIPADVAASPFYFSNLQNNITGNAVAGGGFAGFTMVGFRKVINGGSFTPSDYVPEDRPTMEDGFYGNSCRSVGWFWNLAPCFYVGGVLYEDNNNKLTYVPARVSSSSDKRHPKSIVDGTDAWNIFVNSRAALCPVAGGDWNVRGRWYNLDVVDIGDRSMNAFGDQSFRNVYLKCRTNNTDGTATVSPATTFNEKMWPDVRLKGFRSYDTGQKHIVEDWIVDCGSQASPLMGTYVVGRAQIWSFPHGVNINQHQIVFSNITYVDAPDQKKLLSYDVGSKDTYSSYYMTFTDADGSMTLRRENSDQPCVPTVAGTAGMIHSVSSGGDSNNLIHLPANMWYKLTGLDEAVPRGESETDDRCALHTESEYPFWLCDQGKVNVGSFMPVPNERDGTRTQEFGRLTHWGDTITQGVPMSGQARVTGPFEHSKRGGWFIQFYKNGDDNTSTAAPKKLEIDKVQLAVEKQVLMVATQYPSGTTFAITRKHGSRLADVYTYTKVDSVEEVRGDDTGTTYFFDDTYLYLRLFPSGDKDEYFVDGPIWVPNLKGNRETTVQATWSSGSGCAENDWCPLSSPAAPPGRDVGVVENPTTIAEAAACPPQSTLWPLRTWALSSSSSSDSDSGSGSSGLYPSQPPSTPTPTPTPTPSSSDSSVDVTIIAGAAAGGAAFVLAIVAVCWLRRKRTDFKVMMNPAVQRQKQHPVVVVMPSS